MHKEKEPEESLRITDVNKKYGRVTALDRMSLTVRNGEFLTILGPSGSGKTTLLKIIAGFEAPTSGHVYLNGNDITHVQPAHRGIGMVFQNYALFPHKTVAQNIAFPLRMRKMRATEIAKKVQNALDLVELSGFGDRRPSQLSGGQQQRIALARAIVFDPQLLLLDEPFGALDRMLREQMQLQVKALQRRLGLTAILVTHDQEEALMLSDRIVVMNNGSIRQVDTPENIYAQPRDRFVASFVGESNLYDGVVTERTTDCATIRVENGPDLVCSDTNVRVGDAVSVVIRPEAVSVATGEGNSLNLVVEDAIFTGGSWRYLARNEDGCVLIIRSPSSPDTRHNHVGDKITASIPSGAVRVVT